MKILLVCSAGMSTSLLENSIKKHMEDNNIKGDVIAKSASVVRDELSSYDVVLLGPQVRFLHEEFKEIANGTPIDVIPPHFYAMAKGEEVYKMAEEMSKKGGK